MNQLISLMVLFLVCCCTRTHDNINSKKDSLSVADSSSSITITHTSEASPQLDIENFKVYSYTDTAINFKQPSYLGDHDLLEPGYLKNDPRVERIGESLQFKLKNGETKIFKDSESSEDEEYVRYTFIKSWDDVGQWQVLSMYNESFSYLLIDQMDGAESIIWGDPAFSPDKKYFVTGSADIDAGFIPNGFQLWTFKDNKPFKVWEKELTDWGADNLIWTSNNDIIGEQIYRDADLGESNKRIIKMQMIYSETH